MGARKLLSRLCFVVFCNIAFTSPAKSTLEAQDPDNALSDPVLRLEHTPAEIAFERAPNWMVRACNDVPYHHMWIFAETARPEGLYILASGSVWVQEDQVQPPKFDLINNQNGDIDLIRKDHSCTWVENPDYAFDGMSSSQAGGPLTPALAAIVHDLAVDLIRREEKIFGGRDGFFKALAATGHSIKDQQSVMVPLLEALK